jgi:hypothetical protein
MGGDETKDTKSVASAAPTARREGLRDKFVVALFVILTSVVGTIVAALLQQRGWAWQNKVMGVEEDTKSAVDTLHSASDLLDKRWSATFQMVRAMENAKAGDELKAAKDTYLSVNHEWELGFANVYSAVQFNVDRPFDIGMSRIPEALWTLNCDTFPFSGEEGGTLEPGSAHIMLKLIDHCHGLVKTNIDELSKGSIDQRLIVESYLRLSHIYYITDALRCVILQRAVTMRSSLDTEELSWGSFLQSGPQKYSIPIKGDDCLGQYREWYRRWYEENRKK